MIKWAVPHLLNTSHYFFSLTSSPLFLLTGIIIVSSLPCCFVSLFPSCLSLYLSGGPFPDLHAAQIHCQHLPMLFLFFNNNLPMLYYVWIFFVALSLSISPSLPSLLFSLSCLPLLLLYPAGWFLLVNPFMQKKKKKILLKVHFSLPLSLPGGLGSAFLPS